MILSGHLRKSLSQSPAAIKRAEWLVAARAAQITPAGDWRHWLVMAGRGFGKTRLGAEDAWWHAATNPGNQVAVVAPTYNDVRGTCFEGVSGIIACASPEIIAEYNRTRLELTLINGAKIRGFSADSPERLRGPQFHRAWCDELAAWQYAEAWDQLLFGLRLGDDPKSVITTTPKPSQLVRALTKQPGVLITRGSTFDNAANLAPPALAALREKYEGTRLGRQELYAELLDDVPGALWTRDMIAPGPAPDLARVVVGVDPSGTAGGEGSDSVGIVAVGAGVDGRFYVLEDATCNLSPAGWARRVVEVYSRHKADRVVAEANFGGAMVESTLRTADKHLPVRMVSASRGKAVRAEPIAALYEQRRVTHTTKCDDSSWHLDALEDQMMQMTPSGYVGQGSPDRVDALVWALTELALGAENRLVW